MKSANPDRSFGLRRSLVRIRTSLALACLLAAGLAAAQSVWPVYDVNADRTRGAANRAVMQGFGDGSINSAFVKELHEGLDILADGRGGQEVAAARAGRVIQIQSDVGGIAGNGAVMVRVRVGGTDANPVFETDRYLHVTGIRAALLNTDIAAGVKLGNIADVFGAGSNHLHFAVFRGSQTTRTFGADQLLNPLARFTAAADRDPGRNLPALADTNADGRSIVFTRTGTLTPVRNGAISGGVDIVADIRDNMNPNFLGGSGVHQSGYYVKALFNRGVPKHDVGTREFPYILAKFDDEFFRNAGARIDALGRVIYASDGTNRGFFNVTRATPVVGFNNTVFPLNRNYIVTNTDSNSGAVRNIKDTEFWNTSAKNDPLITDGSSRANFAFSAQAAARNAEARFRDGDYEVHILAGDLGNDLQDLVAGKARLDNFAQGAAVGRDGAPALAHADLDPLWNSATPFLAGYSPLGGESTDPLFTFFIGDAIAVQGDQFYPDLRMPVWITPHKASWTEGLSFSSAAGLLVGDVLSDANGFVTLTNTGYIASQVGQFDLIIDYDRNGAFSATLDGLAGFTVAVPEPASWLLWIGGVLAVGTRAARRVPAAAGGR